MESFKVQTPEWYELIYSKKNYELESTYIKKLFKKHNKSIKFIADIGSGTGKLIPYFINEVEQYIAVEPYKDFCEFIKKNHQNNLLQVRKNKFQEFINNIDKKINLIVANFNVLNYLKFSELIACFKKLSENLDKNTIVIFDTWSLDFINKQPLNMKSVKLIETNNNSNKYFLEDYSILRFSNSNYSKKNGFIDIQFDFVAINPNNFKKIGSEKHRIYPFNILNLIKEMEKIGWINLHINKYSDIEKDLKVLKSEDNFFEERNYYLSFKLN